MYDLRNADLRGRGGVLASLVLWTLPCCRGMGVWWVYRFGFRHITALSEAHGTGVAITVDPVGAVVGIKVLAPVLVKSAAA